MAYPLLSPGVDVEVTDEAFYASPGQGTVPLIIFIPVPAPEMVKLW